MTLHGKKLMSGSGSGPGIWQVLTWIVMAAYAVIGVFVLNVAIENHAGGLATSIMDGADSLGLSGMWELQANLREDRVWFHLMMWGFIPIDGFASLLFGDSWQTFYLDLLSSIGWVILTGVLVWQYAREVLRDERAAFLLVVLYFLLPASFANAIYWYGQPVFVLLMLALFAMRRGWTWLAVLLTVWALGCHPMAVPVFFGLAWGAFRPHKRWNGAPLLPGVDPAGEKARRCWKISLATCVVLTLWTGFLVVMSRLGDTSSTRGLLWDFFSGKLEPGALPRNVIQVVFFLLPMLFLPVINLTWLAALIAIAGYMILGSQGIVTGFLLPATGFAVAAMAHWMQRLSSSVRWKVALGGILIAVAGNLLVPWSVFFPMAVEPLTGGLFARHTWQVQAQEAATNEMIRQNIPAGTDRCLATWQTGPVMSQRCDFVTTLSFPFRRETYRLQDFLDTGDRGRVASGWWDYILIDLRRERTAAGLDSLLERIESAGCWEVAARTDEAVLFRKVPVTAGRVP